MKTELSSFNFVQDIGMESSQYPEIKYHICFSLNMHSGFPGIDYCAIIIISYTFINFYKPCLLKKEEPRHSKTFE